MYRAGDKLGPYILIHRLGRGAFGVVWLAEKRTLITTTKVALKLPHDEDVDIEAIKQEASVWVHASGHPNVLPIIDADIYDDQIVIVSEYAPDGSLSDWLKRYGGKAPSIESSIEMMLGILAGLDHLHSRGIIHRDLKPANILLQGCAPRLADFGIARVLKTTSNSTVAAGTPAYMPPEAFIGKRSKQSDIWSAGVVFHQMLSGTLPFPQRDVISLMGAITSGEPEPLPDFIPTSLRVSVEQSLQKSPEHRYESANEMRRLLRTESQYMYISYGNLKTEYTDTHSSYAVNYEAETVASLTVELFAQSDVGRVQARNEDNFLIADLSKMKAWTGSDGADVPNELQRFSLGPNGLVLAVSDGVGNKIAGYIASRMAVESVRDMLIGDEDEDEVNEFSLRVPLVEAVRRASGYANLAIHNKSQEDARCTGMCATLTAAAIQGDHIDLLQVGDSRAYILRDRYIKLVTKDQTLAQQLIDDGRLSEEEDAAHSYQNEILQTLGGARELSPVMGRVRIQQEDILLLCSDGLSNKLRAEDMLHLVKSAGDNLASACSELIGEANARSGEGNITVILARFTGAALPSHLGSEIKVEFPPLDEDDTLSD